MAWIGKGIHLRVLVVWVYSPCPVSYGSIGGWYAFRLEIVRFPELSHVSKGVFEKSVPEALFAPARVGQHLGGIRVQDDDRAAAAARKPLPQCCYVSFEAGSRAHEACVEV